MEMQVRVRRNPYRGELYIGVAEANAPLDSEQSLQAHTWLATTNKLLYERGHQTESRPYYVHEGSVLGVEVCVKRELIYNVYEVEVITLIRHKVVQLKYNSLEFCYFVFCGFCL